MVKHYTEAIHTLAVSSYHLSYTTLPDLTRADGYCLLYNAVWCDLILFSCRGVIACSKSSPPILQVLTPLHEKGSGYVRL